MAAREKREPAREPMSIYEVHLGSWRPGLSYRRAGRRAGRLRHRPGLHARGVPARGRAPVRRLVGLPGHLLLRAHVAVRLPRRLPLPGRRAAPGRASACCSTGCPRTSRATAGRWPGSTARAVRARRPAARHAPRLGHAHLRLRAPRGAELPGRQRGLLARGVPHRRAAGRRGGVHAVPGLLAQGRRVGAEPVRRPGEPRGDRVPAGGQRHLLQARPRHRDDRRGVDLLGGRHPAGAPGRAGVRLQVEHGLDARHARLPGPRPHLPPVPPQPDDVLDDLRVLGELHPAAVARRGGAREGLAGRQDARRRMA